MSACGAVRELAGLEIPTVAAGVAVDEFLFAPAPCAPSTFLPPLAPVCSILITLKISLQPHLLPHLLQPHLLQHLLAPVCTYFPAAALEYTRLRDHLRFLLSIPCDSEDIQVNPARRIREELFSEKDWAARDAALSAARALFGAAGCPSRALFGAAGCSSAHGPSQATGSRLGGRLPPSPSALPVVNINRSHDTTTLALRETSWRDRAASKSPEEIA